jgi:hypothetical protein
LSTGVASQAALALPPVGRAPRVVRGVFYKVVSMLISLLAAGLILAADTPRASGQEVVASDQSGGVEASKPAQEARPKPKCHYVSVTGARSKRRVCSDNPDADAAAAAGVRGPSSTMGRAQQGNINN